MFIRMLTDLETALQYILEIIRCLHKTDCFSGRFGCRKNCPGFMLVVLVKKQSAKWINIKTTSKLWDDEGAFGLSGYYSIVDSISKKKIELDLESND